MSGGDRKIQAAETERIEIWLARAVATTEEASRFVVDAGRADAAEAGAHSTAEATRLVDELSESSPEFRKLW